MTEEWDFGRCVEALERQALLDTASAEFVAKTGRLQRFDPGDQLMSQGGDDQHVVFIVDGRVQILVDGRLVATRTTGDAIGEMAALEPAGKRSATVVAEHATRAMLLARNEFLELANSIDVMRRIAEVLADRLRERNQYIRPRSDRPKLFVGSSVESLEIAKALKANLEHAPVSVVLWTQSVFTPNTTTIESLEKALDLYDFAAFVFAPDDMHRIRGKDHAAVRDNVLFEYGLFLGALGRDRVFVVRPRTNMRVPTDMYGITCLDYDPNDPEIVSALGTAAVGLEHALTEHGPR